MTKYTVTGGTPLVGEVQLHGAKNAGFKAMIAALLADSPSQICQLGLISEIDFAKQMISQLGGHVRELSDPHCLEVDPRGLSSGEISREIGQKSRSSTMYVGPLLKRFGKAVLPVPVGDKIGSRPVDRHIEGLETLGAKVDFEDGAYHVEARKGLHGGIYRFRKNTHTGTETLLMCAVFARGQTILENAAEEPEIDDLIKYLNSMGAQVVRTAPRVIKVVGVSKLHGAKHEVMNDQNEAVTFACAALATKGNIVIKGVDKSILTAFIEKTKEAGGEIEDSGKGIRCRWVGKLRATDVVTLPYPGFKTDWQPVWTALMTQAEGVSVIHETVFENRFGHISDLTKMGGKFEMFNPKVADPEKTYNFNLVDDVPGNFHAVKIFGPVKLQGSEIEINDIRRGATVLLAGMVAFGQTTIIDPKDQIKRGYEDLVGQMVRLGAKIVVN